MKRSSYAIVLIAILAVALAGCSRQSDPLMPEIPEGDHPSALGSLACPPPEFVISGTVYVDTDLSGTMEADESGIGNVTVTLARCGEDVASTITDADGYFMFVQPAGTYTIRIDGETDADDFNEELAASFDPTGPTSLNVTVGPNSPGNDFGFEPKVEEITAEIAQGTLPTDGESTKFWRKQLNAAIHGGTGASEFDVATMAQFVADIQELYFPIPFQFTPGNEFQEALSILKPPTKEPLDILLKELLAAEFNEVSGKGLVGASGLQGVLLSWAESVAIEASAVSPVLLSRPLLGGPIDDRVAGAIDLLTQLNGTTGGGSGGGG